MCHVLILDNGTDCNRLASDFHGQEALGMEKLYDVGSAAERLGRVSKSTIRSWFTKGLLQRTKIGRRTMVTESELERFIRSGQQKKSASDTQKQ
jgi:hypothetical protein